MLRMADKVQITPLIAPETRELLRAACQERRCSQGDIVEHALLAFLQPLDQTESLRHMAYQQEQLAQAQRTMQDMLERLMAALGALPTPEPPPALAEPLPIATYEQMYGPLEGPIPAVETTPAPSAYPSRLRRWFLREVPS
jgi:hypothetical protein